MIIILLLACREPAEQTENGPGDDPTVTTDPTLPVPEAVDTAYGVDSAAETGDTGPEPPLFWTYVDTDSIHSCGLVSDGSVRCWGIDECTNNTPRPWEQLTQISLGIGQGCGLRPDGTLLCWNCDHFDEEVRRETPPGVFLRVEVGAGAACAQDAAGILTCWGVDFVVGTPPPGPVLDFALDANATAAVLPDGSIIAWGDAALWGDDSPPVGVVFSNISMGRRHACGLDTTGLAWCWGDSQNLSPFPPAPPGVWAQIETFNDASCVIDDLGTVSCWYGYPSVSFSLWESQRPAVPFAQLGLGEWDGCGVTLTGEAYCWGGDPSVETWLDVPDLNP
ncbi:MAG: hypothetical protein H0U77_03310 [Nocardioidaceae bacterium]|nr:hypothetical protein [Nocardioidaceae bacterium]